MVIADGKLIVQPRETVRGAICRPAPDAFECAPDKPFTRRAKWPEGEWRCVFDPSGDFTGAQFGIYDLRFTSAKRHWTEGTKFQNIRSQETLIIRKGMLRTC